jgi:hypothetical protein
MSKPAFNAYVVTNYGTEDSKKAAWRQIGVAFPHKTGGGFDLVLDALPVSGRVVLMPPKEDEKASK